MAIQRVLVVDDSESARLVLRKMLQHANLHVDMAASAQEALDYLRTQHPDAIFMDHSMPGMDGLQAVDIIKNNSATAMIPVAMYTSKEGDEYIKEAKAHGVIEILSKPATPSSLNAVLRKLDGASASNDKVVSIDPLNHIEEPDQQTGLTPRTVKNIARTTAEAIIYNATQGQLIPLLENRFAKLREELQINSQTLAADILGKLQEVRPDSLVERITQKIHPMLLDLRATIETATKLDDQFLDEIRTLLKNQLIERMSETLSLTIESKLSAASMRPTFNEEFFESMAKQLAPHLLQQSRETKHPMRESFFKDDELVGDTNGINQNEALALHHQNPFAPWHTPEQFEQAIERAVKHVLETVAPPEAVNSQDTALMIEQVRQLQLLVSELKEQNELRDQQNIGKMDSKAFEELKNIVRSVATHKANESTREIAGQMASNVINKIVEEIAATRKTIIQHLYLIATLAVALILSIGHIVRLMLNG